jgi:DNA-binding transcriptional ArsR family regulator
MIPRSGLHPSQRGPVAGGRSTPPLPSSANSSEASAADVERLAAVLSRARARVLLALRQARTTEQVAEEIGAANSTASEHLNALAKARLATRRREQRLVYYELSERGRRLLALLVEDDR